jgi:hypothetical protein
VYQRASERRRAWIRFGSYNGQHVECGGKPGDEAGGYQVEAYCSRRLDFLLLIVLSD